MAERPRSDFAVLAGGILMLLASLAHSFVGGPALLEELAREGVNADNTAGMLVGWLFGGTAMGLLGILTIIGYRRLRRGDDGARSTLFAIGAFWILFGLGASLYRFPSPHFLGFLVIGGLVCIPPSVWPWRR